MSVMCRYGDIWLVGGFNPSEKYQSQLRLLFPIYGKNGKKKNVPNHQPDGDIQKNQNENMDIKLLNDINRGTQYNVF